MYADDLILISISCLDLQLMFNLCSVFFKSINLAINILKCHCVRIGPRSKYVCEELTIDNIPIKWVDKFRFLGVWILKGNSLKFDWQEAKRKFFYTSNNIFSKLGSNPNIALALHIFLSKCIPLLTYAHPAICLSKKEIASLTFCYNTIYYKLFGVKDVTLINQCQFFTGVLSFELQYELSRLLFLKKLVSSNVVNSYVEADVNDIHEYDRLRLKFGVNDFDSNYCIKCKIWTFFESLIFP
jgi:hypothetical protein